MLNKKPIKQKVLLNNTHHSIDPLYFKYQNLQNIYLTKAA